MTMVKHEVPWRNSSPKPASSQDGIGNAGETRRFRSDKLQELDRQHAATAAFHLPAVLPKPDKELEKATEIALFRQNFPEIGLDEILNTWSPGTDLTNAAWGYYRQRKQAREDRAWDRADEWTMILRESEQWNATSRAGMFKFSGNANVKDYPPSPVWYKLSDTPKTARWAKNALCVGNLLGQDFLDQMSAAEHRRRLHDHIRHRESLHRQENLVRERRIKTVFRRKLKRQPHQEKGRENNEQPDVYERLLDLTSNKVKPDFTPENDITTIVQSFQTAVRRVVPHLNLHLLQTYPLPEHIARTAKNQVLSSRRQKKRELNDKATARSVAVQIEHFERMLNARRLQTQMSAAAEDSAAIANNELLEKTY